GMSYLLEGDLDRADPILAMARADADRDGALPLTAMILAERCVVAQERNDAARVESLAAQALAIVEWGGLEQYWTSALIYACAAPLTVAELRLLPLLATHLSLGQIGEQLHVARATVKAQTTSIYRKLRVSSRSEAVNRSRELGLDLRSPESG